jgi:hypothetical protein
MKKSDQKLKYLINHFPTTFSIKPLFFSKQPTRLLKTTQLCFYISCLTMLFLQILAKSNGNNLALVVTILFESAHMYFFNKWITNHPDYFEIREISYFVKNHIFTKTDYLIAISKLESQKKSRFTNSEKVMKNFPIIIPIFTAMVNPVNTFIRLLLQNHSKNIVSSVTLILFIAIMIFVSVYYLKANTEAKRLNCLQALHRIEDLYFSKSNGMLKTKLLSNKAAGNQDVIKDTINPKYRLPK